MNQQQEDAKKYQEFVEMTEQMGNELLKVYKKHAAKNSLMATSLMISSPLNIVMNIFCQADEEGYKEEIMQFDMPGILIRMLKPWIALADKWGKIPMVEFVELYKKKYEEIQRSHFGPEAIERANKAMKGH